ncbi:MAG: dual specificity protein phosphatase family protein [Phycisphaerae bacterium]|nr:dual specificity protein phosphatase family protein [Phycisphaerae bacterium]
MTRKILLMLLLIAPPIATAIVTRLQSQPRRFAEVVPGAIYRGGRPTPEQIRDLGRDRHIRTILSLLEDKSTPEDRDRRRAARASNIRLMCIPMPGNGTAEFALLDMAADAIANPSNQPVFYHCAAGKQRSNAVLAAYRLRHCGWTLEQVIDELVEKYDLEKDGEEKPLMDYLARYASWLAVQQDRPSSGNASAKARNRAQQSSANLGRSPPASANTPQ